ncbi:MAG: 3'-5' exoribonuclease YhaM family protein [Candidatus Dojkabacteria bacterium]
MKSLYVRDLEKGMTVAGEVFAVQEVEQGETRNGKPFYKTVFTDKTGTVKGQIWSDKFDNVDRKALKPGNVVMLDATVDEFRGSLQLNVLKLTRVDETKLDEFIEASDFDLDDLWEDLTKYIEDIKRDDLREFLEKIFEDKEFVRNFKTAPAAVLIHHSFRGGLMEHVLEILAMADSIRRYYPEADFDLVVVGAILHDIGKLWEIESVGMVSQFSKKGKLIGHVIQGFEFVIEKASGILDEETLLQLKHIVLSHQGEKEYGSPVVPSTIEAILVSSLDNASFKIRAFQKIIRKDIDKEGDFTSYDRYAGTSIYKGNVKNG